MSLEREIKHNDWRESFKKVETKVCTSDRFTRLTNNASLQRPNSSLNRYILELFTNISEREVSQYPQ